MPLIDVIFAKGSLSPEAHTATAQYDVVKRAALGGGSRRMKCPRQSRGLIWMSVQAHIGVGPRPMVSEHLSDQCSSHGWLYGSRARRWDVA